MFCILLAGELFGTLLVGHKEEEVKRMNSVGWVSDLFHNTNCEA